MYLYRNNASIDLVLIARAATPSKSKKGSTGKRDVGLSVDIQVNRYIFQLKKTQEWLSVLKIQDVFSLTDRSHSHSSIPAICLSQGIPKCGSDRLSYSRWMLHPCFATFLGFISHFSQMGKEMFLTLLQTSHIL